MPTPKLQVAKPSPALLARASEDKPTATAKDMQQIAELVKQLETLDARIAKGEQLLADLNAERRKLADVAIPTLFDSAGVNRLKLSDGTDVSIATSYHPNVKADDQPKLIAWLRKTGNDSIIKNDFRLSFGKGEEKLAAKLSTLLEKQRFVYSRKEDVNPQTFKAFVREQLEAKARLPKFIDPNPVRTTKIKAAKGE